MKSKEKYYNLEIILLIYSIITLIHISLNIFNLLYIIFLTEHFPLLKELIQRVFFKVKRVFGVSFTNKRSSLGEFRGEFCIFSNVCSMVIYNKKALQTAILRGL